ncbi:MAG: hypothetical protein HYR85_08780 [Planctomycetes bacterium]|nr:hypothetical protein [Planctomycetota bacterium]
MSFGFKHWVGIASLVLAAWGVAATPASAQCGPDGLSGPCCTPAGATLPAFPALTTDVRFICFESCQRRLDRPLCLVLGAPTAPVRGGGPVCGLYTIRATVKTCGTPGQVLWSGTLRAQYVRNWLEIDTFGNQLGSWRFLLNADLVPSALVTAQTNPCVKPGCVSTFGRVYFSGYIDYAFDCINGRWLTSGALNHDKDFIAHASFTGRPAGAAGFHPTVSFDFVWPSANFVINPATIPFSQGTSNQGSIRRNDFPSLPAICRNRDPLAGATVVPGNQSCPCNPAVASAQYIDTLIRGNTVCNSSYISQPPPTVGGFTQKRIGNWVAPQYPGDRFLLIDQGFATQVDACIGITSTEWFEGVETLHGFPATDYAGNVLGRQFEDWESSNGVGGALLIGVPHVSWYMIELNMP